MSLRDELAVWNERVKLAAGFLNALGLGLIGFAVLRPATDDVALLSFGSLGWGIIGLAMHGLAHYVIGKLRKESAHDDL
ncbi:hypothetical protein [Jannaschia formosa]|uniref:hypothetical protein n=1 Tax=Jannaschia formosa TaxID=2259592 RepID=UPI000E1B8248|nr:hypothetical protein [Jannaschia formosa]TFL16781.1 hypothetical protein DR046_17995 [Jannaschia formosa]